MKRFADPHEALKQVFGYDHFRGLQAQAVAAALEGRDALVLMPTGGGKSLCYQIPALVKDGLTVVVSPLIALMQDQVESLAEVGVRAAFLNSTQTSEDAMRVRREVRAGEIDLLYVAPERLLTAGMLDFLDTVKVALFAIDEAHCVSIWGHDFRPVYGELAILRERWPSVPRMALTATADERTREEIVGRLLVQPDELVASFDRPNIYYSVVEKRNVKDQLLRFIRNRHPGECGIVYCLSRANCELIAAHLEAAGINALAYHAGMLPEDRAQRLARFQREEDIVMVATIAFGMGIDKPNVRFVAHADLPKSVEGYFQETGRAGRDGLPAEAWMAYGLNDVMNQNRFIDQSDADDNWRRLQRQKLDAMLGYAETCECRRVRLLAHFGEASKPCGNCDNCRRPPKMIDALTEAKMLISCIWRLQQKSGMSFGATHVVDVLLGAKTEPILRHGHDQVSTYGIGTGHTKQQWRSIVRQLIAQHILWVDTENFSVLRLGEKANAVLRDEIAVRVRASVAEDGGSANRSGAAEALHLTGRAKRLFEALRRWRAAEARASGKPAYLIFTDRTLAQISKKPPRREEDFDCIQGLGRKKIERYAPDILRITAETLDD